MSEPADASVTDASRPAPFTMVTGDPAAMVCEGDVCFVPAPDGAADPRD
ncbi:hypothetical protein [Agromyces intestinalis]|nr:hypothetical protein [Agromyces intestinalis]